MITLETKAYAKVNLTLDILGKRPDGFHDLQSVMQQISICDDIEIDLETGEDWSLECDRDDVPADSSNLAWKAAGLFYKRLGKDPQGVSIRIIKRIPSRAGLGGGSADAAAVLNALNAHEGSPFTVAQLAEMGAKIGSDVPFCVMGGTALCEGRGEILTKLKDMPQCFYCVAMPDFAVSTKELFEIYDQRTVSTHPDTPHMLEALDAEDLLKVAGYCCNSMEKIVAADYPKIWQMRTVMEDCGALGSAMSGSGSAVYGIFDAFDMAAMASMRLMEHGFTTFLARNV